MGPRRTTAPEAAGGWATRHPPRASSPRGRRGSGVTADPRDRSRADPAGYTAHARMIPNVRRYSLGRHSAKATRRLRLPPEGPDGLWDDGRLVGQPDGLERIRADRLAAQVFDEPRRAIGDRGGVERMARGIPVDARSLPRRRHLFAERDDPDGTRWSCCSSRIAAACEAAAPPASVGGGPHDEADGEHAAHEADEGGGTFRTLAVDGREQGIEDGQPDHHVGEPEDGG